MAKQLLSGLTSRIVGSHICVGNHCGTHGPLNPNWPPQCRGRDEPGWPLIGGGRAMWTVPTTSTLIRTAKAELRPARLFKDAL